MRGSPFNPIYAGNVVNVCWPLDTWHVYNPLASRVAVNVMVGTGSKVLDGCPLNSQVMDGVGTPWAIQERVT